jgi:hypothetical protein
MGKEGVQFRVESLENLSVIIDHFNRYPLQTKKQLDFKLFKLALTCLKNKEHLTSFFFPFFLIIIKLLHISLYIIIKKRKKNKD